MDKTKKKLLQTAGFSKEIERIEHGFCPLCIEIITVEEFRDTLSRKEYEISGMCQKCQDKAFGGI